MCLNAPESCMYRLSAQRYPAKPSYCRLASMTLPVAAPSARRRLQATMCSAPLHCSSSSCTDARICTASSRFLTACTCSTAAWARSSLASTSRWRNAASACRPDLRSSRITERRVKPARKTRNPMTTPVLRQHAHQQSAVGAHLTGLVRTFHLCKAGVPIARKLAHSKSRVCASRRAFALQLSFPLFLPKCRTFRIHIIHAHYRN